MATTSTGATGSTLRVLGLAEFLKAVAAMPPEIKKEVRAALREAGQKVRADAASKTADRLRSQKSAAGYRVVVRQRGVSVEQRLRKTTGLRKDWGSTQMRDSLIPALEENEDDTLRRFEEATLAIIENFDLIARWQGEGLIGRL